jgi:hypothetical protein
MTKFYREIDLLPDGREVEGGLYRRERVGDITSDSVFWSDGRWHSTGDISMSMKGYNDISLREVSESEAAEFLEAAFRAGSQLHAPMVADSED